MTPLEYMERQVTKHQRNYEREAQRHVPEEMLRNIETKIRHYEAAVVALKEISRHENSNSRVGAQ